MSQPLWINIISKRENVDAQFIAAQGFLLINVKDADISHDIESLDQLTFGNHTDFHDGMWAVYSIVITFNSIILRWVSFLE